MAEKCHVTGKISTNQTLSLSGSGLDGGKWTAGPNTSVGPGTGVVAFEAKGRSDSATGAEGWVEYSAPDGAKFRLYFDDPYSEANQATITGESGPFQAYTYSVSYPDSGKEWDASYTIDRN